MDNQHERLDKIVKMKVQTAKVLWQEDRREAAFLVLESVDDPRADALRERLGFDEHYDVGHTRRQGVSWPLLGGTVGMALIIAFVLGTRLDLDPEQQAPVPFITAETSVATPILATLPAQVDEIELTGTASQIRLTQLALEAQQGGAMSLLDATETARYQQATATAEARETVAADG